MHRVAVIGAGIGAEHCAGYAALPDLFEIAAICDLDAARGQGLASRYGAEFTPEIDIILSDPAIDLVDICLPPHLHFDAICNGLDAGKAVICEKPLTTSLALTDQIIAQCDHTGGRVFPVFQYRYGIGMAQFRAVQSAGLVGQCFAASLETHWDRDKDYYTIPWRGTWDGEQGGAVLGHAIHIHDLIVAMLGPVSSVFARLATSVNAIEVDDCAAISMEMASGALVSSSVTLGAAGNQSRLRLMCEKATIQSDLAPYAPAAKPWSFIARNPDDQTRIDKIIAETPETDFGFTGFLKSVADDLDGKSSNTVTLDDARKSLELVSAIYASSRNNRPQDLPLSSDHPLYRGWRGD